MIIEQAINFATTAHMNQRRDYTKHPYIWHPLRVGMKLQTLGQPDDVVCAGILHDTIEDCGVSEKDISFVTNENVAKLVSELTNPSKGSNEPRDVRKKMDREKLKSVSNEAKIIKLVDRIDNLNEMGGAPIDFKFKYLGESYLLYKECLVGVHPMLCTELLTVILAMYGTAGIEHVADISVDLFHIAIDASKEGRK